MNGADMAAEIMEQPRVLERILGEGRPQIGEVACALRRRGPRFVLFVARGSSDHAALYAKYLVETRLALPAGLVSPSTRTVYHAQPDLRDVLLVAVSQSGGSPDLLESLSRARASGAITVAVTNAPDSELAREAEHHVSLLAGSERAIAATKTYTAELLTLYCLVEALRGPGTTPGGTQRVPAKPAAGYPVSDEVESLPEQAQAVLDREPEIAQLAVRYRFAEQLVTAARGYNYATARETALKLMETSYLVAQAFSAADLLHGPMAMVDRGFPIPLRCPEVLTPVLLILPMQQFAWHLARQRGIDPDQPRGLRKVTRTW